MATDNNATDNNATDKNATDEVPGLLHELPDGRRFATVEEVWETVH